MAVVNRMASISEPEQQSIAEARGESEAYIERTGTAEEYSSETEEGTKFIAIV